MEREGDTYLFTELLSQLIFTYSHFLKFNSLILTGTKICPSCLESEKKGHCYPVLFTYLGFLNDDDELVFVQIFQSVRDQQLLWGFLCLRIFLSLASIDLRPRRCISSVFSHLNVCMKYMYMICSFLGLGEGEWCM